MPPRTRKLATQLLVLTTILFACQSAFGSRTKWGRLNWYMQSLQQGAEMYQWEHGQYPATDAQSTWYQKLQADDLVTADPVYELPDGSLPIDNIYGFPLIYQPPTKQGELPLIRAVGPNGIDDGGTLDDWDSGSEPNWGYWYKSNWSKYLRQTILATIAVVIGGVLTTVYLKPRKVGIPVALIYAAIVFNLIAPTSFRHTWLRGPFNVVTDISIVLQYAAMIAAAQLVICGCARFFPSKPPDPTLCQSCGYDLRGTLAANRHECPECGAPAQSANVNIADER